MNENRILFVDLDGTLIKEDLSNLAFIYFVKKKPLILLFHLIVFIFKGKAYLKEVISKGYTVPVEKLNFNEGSLEYIKNVKNHHRIVYLISGSHQLLVNQIDEHLKIFYESFGTNNNLNMVGINKVKFINDKLNIFDFDYLGNSEKDLPIWKYTKKVIYTNISKKLKRTINKLNLDKLEVKENFKK